MSLNLNKKVRLGYMVFTDIHVDLHYQLRKQSQSRNTAVVCILSQLSIPPKILWALPSPFNLWVTVIIPIGDSGKILGPPLRVTTNYSHWLLSVINPLKQLCCKSHDIWEGIEKVKAWMVKVWMVKVCTCTCTCTLYMYMYIEVLKNCIGIVSYTCKYPYVLRKFTNSKYSVISKEMLYLFSPN